MKIAVIENNLRNYVIDTIRKYPESNIEVSCIAEWKNSGSKWGDIPVKSIRDLNSSDFDAVLVAVSDNRFLSRLLTFLHQREIENIYIIRLFALDKHEDFISSDGFDSSRVDKVTSLDEKPYMTHIEVHVCDNCNLNCKACNNFSPFFKESSCTDLSLFQQSLVKLSGLFSTVGRFFLLGGEPLLQPELACKMIESTRKIFPISEIRVLTNAILTEKMPAYFWECLRKNDVIVQISLYPPVTAAISRIEGVLQKENIRYHIIRKVVKFLKHWAEYPIEDEVYNNDRCGSAGCHYIRDGVIAKCPDAILIGQMAERIGKKTEDLQSSQNINLDDVTDGWALIKQLDAPIDLCKKCTFHNDTVVDWARTESVPDPADWIVDNQLVYENKKLISKNSELSAKLSESERNCSCLSENYQNISSQCSALERKYSEASADLTETKIQLRNAEKKEGLLTAELAAFRQEFESLEKLLHSTQEQNEELKNQLSKESDVVRTLQVEVKDREDKLAEQKTLYAKTERECSEANLKLSEARNSIAKLRGQNTDISKKLSHSEESLRAQRMQLDKLTGDYNAMQKSISFRLGRAITWLPRKVRNFFVCIRDNGKVYTAMKIFEKIFGKNAAPTKILFFFRKDMLAGFDQYSKLLTENNVSNIYCQYYKGTGDVYISASYLKYCEQNIGVEKNINDSIFVINGKNAYNVSNLFKLNTKTVMVDEASALLLGHLYRFVGSDKIHIKFLHYLSTWPVYTTRIIWLAGLNGLNFMDLYDAVVFNEKGIRLPTPIWNESEARVEQMFKENGFVASKTVLLSPHSYSVKPGPPISEWKKLTDKLIAAGYTVCTNSAGRQEPPIEGTKSILVPYADLYAFLMKGGTFIGYRSGLCDLVATIPCRKIILYPDCCWPVYNGLNLGSTLEIFSLRNMGLCDDVEELTVSLNCFQKIGNMIIDAEN